MSKELTTVQNIINALSEFYTTGIYTVVEDKDTDDIVITSKEKNTFCGSLKFNNENKYIRVEFINKCDTSGTQFLEYLELFAIKYNYNILLMDRSTINVNNNKINLSHLKILTKGQSWYNSKGYKSDHYD